MSLVSRPRWFVGVAVAVLLSPRVAAAQFRQVPALTLTQARQALVAAADEAARHNRTYCVVVVDAGGEVLALERHDGVAPAICDAARAKARTAARFGRPSRAWGELLGRGNPGALLNVPDMFAVEGGVPVLSGTLVVGAVGVSGASVTQDGELAQLAVAAIMKTAS